MQAALIEHPLLSKLVTHLVDRHPGMDGCSFRQRLDGYGEPACSRCAVPVQQSWNAIMLCQASCRLTASGQKCTAPTIILVDKLLKQLSESITRKRQWVRLALATCSSDKERPANTGACLCTPPHHCNTPWERELGVAWRHMRAAQCITATGDVSEA